MKRFLGILFLLMSLASAGLYQLPNTYVNGSLNVKNATALNITDINGATTAENISLTQGKRIVLNTARTEFIEHNTSGNYFGIWGNPLAVDGFRWTGTLAPTSGSDLIAVGGGSDLNFSTSSGITKTGTGAITLNGDTTVASTKGIALTTADKLTEAGVIVPQLESFTWPLLASSSDEHIWVADDDWAIYNISVVYSSAGSEVAPIAANLTVRVCDNGEAVTAGVASTKTPIWLNGTANTIESRTLGISELYLSNSTMAAGDMISLDYAGTLTGLRGSITFTMQRV